MGIRLFEILKRRRMTISELAEKMGVSQPSMSSYQKSPTLRKMQEIADALNIPVWELLVDCGEQMPADTSAQEDGAVTCSRCGAVLSAQIVVNVKQKSV